MEAGSGMRTCAVTVVTAAAILLGIHSTSEAVTQPWRSLVATELLKIYDAAGKTDASAVAATQAIQQGRAHVDAQGRVQIDVAVDCSLATPMSALTAAGMAQSYAVKVPPFCVVEGWAAPRQLQAIAAVAGVTRVTLPAYAKQRVPPTPATAPPTAKPVGPQASATTTQTIDGNAVSIMHADQFVTKTGINGAGITVGVMSLDATNVSVIEKRGELPTVNVVLPSPNAAPDPSTEDEGTVMLEEVHAVAPGANLAFCGAYTGALYVGCVSQLIAAGATIIVDDLQYYTYDAMSLNNPFTQAVQNLLTQNSQVALFSITENFNNSYWQGAYAPTALSSLGGSTLTCSLNGQVDSYVHNFNGVPYNALRATLAGTYDFWIQWADPFGQNVSNFDIYTLDASTNSLVCIYSATVGGAATYYLDSQAFAANISYYFYIATPDASLKGKFLKVFAGGDGATSLAVPTSGSIVSPQTFAQGVNLTGAVSAADGIGDTIERFSGRGPITLPLPSTQTIPAPSFVAPDGNYVDAQGTGFSGELQNGLFYGTSAAAPNAAAVAALLRSAFPSLTPAEITTALQSGATQLGSSVPDNMSGYGRVDALGALGAVAAPTISNWGSVTVTGGTTSTPSSFTVGGTGTLSIGLTSSNVTLIPGTFGAAGVAGVTVTPANCGQGSTACAIAFTPSAGQSGTASISLTVTDGAKRTATATATVTVTKPAAPTIAISSGATQTVNTNSAIAPISFTLTGTKPLTVTAAGASGITLTSGCGTTTLSCMASPGTSSSSGGTEQITLTVQDGYAQSASATASITVNAPGKSGGGSIELWTLLSLGMLSAARRWRSGRDFDRWRRETGRRDCR